MKKSKIYKPFLQKFGKFNPTIKTNSFKELKTLLKLSNSQVTSKNYYNNLYFSKLMNNNLLLQIYNNRLLSKIKQINKVI